MFQRPATIFLRMRQIGGFPLGPGLRPQPQEQFCQVLHAGPGEPLIRRRSLERGHHRTSLQVVSPQLRLDKIHRKSLISSIPQYLLKLFLPVVSLVLMTLQIIEHALLAPVKAHAATVGGVIRKTTANVPAACVP
ncbi:MAG: hypothetical protein Q8N18_22810 [Opitutaceae bacterium]|nr:hypothetical protein [Opitutaceae bacterium]